MKMDDNILGAVTDDDDEASLLLLNAVADERWDARVSVAALVYVSRLNGIARAYTALRTIFATV